MTHSVKEFVLTHDIEDIQQITGQEESSKIENHFGIQWKMHFHRSYNDDLTLLLSIVTPSEKLEWSVLAQFDLIVSSPKDTLSSRSTCEFSNTLRSCGYYQLVRMSQIKEHYSVNGKCTLEAHVKILKMTGCGKEKSRNFDDPELSDVVLVVQDQKFYISKLFLALQSTYFKSLLLGKFDESKQTEVVLKDIDPGDFQNFLELIHGDFSIDDNTISGILHLSDMYDAPTAIRRCEEFLIKESKTAFIKKFEFSVRYKLESLKEKCLSEIKTVNDIRSVVNANLEDMDGSIVKALLPKLLAFH